MKLIPAGLGLKVGRQLLTVRKDSPRILFAAGIAGIVSTTVLACRATLKLEKTLDEFKNDIDSTKESHVNVVKKDFSTVAYRRDMFTAYSKGTLNLAKLYGPSFVLGGLSVAALTTSHMTLTRRNVSLMAAYSAVSSSFDSYRQRVRDEYGEVKELELHHAARVEKRTIDSKTKEICVANPNTWSPYAKMFDEYNINWHKNPELNKLFITAQQNYLNHLLHVRGHVFLNEAYDYLGFEHTSAGSVVGWVLDNGDNFIDFGMFQAANSRFVDGFERSIILDFNVDGVIYNLI